MSINKKVILTAAVGLALGASSCRKFLNVNTNPNITQTVTVQTLLPAAELYVGSSVGVDLQVDGSIWAQYWTQTPGASQYIAVEDFSVGQEAFTNTWTDLYAGAENFYQLYKLADSLHKKQYKAIALLMQAYTFQVITDGWGDVPFKQALQGQYADGHVTSPKYDSQLVVYNGILSYIDSANKLIDLADPVVPGTDDLIYGGNMSKWIKFSNTLKLKVIMRMSAVNPAHAQMLMDSLYSTNPQFIGEGDDAKISYGANTANKNPLFAEESSTTLAGIQNLAGSSTCIDSMNSNGDPRAYLFYGLASSGNVSGMTQGSYGQAIAPGSYSIPSIYVAGNAGDDGSGKAPVHLLTSWESYFLQAEVVARGWQTLSSGVDDGALFTKGIQASFDYQFYSDALTNGLYGAPATTSIYNDYISGALTPDGTPGYWTVYPTGGSVQDRIKFIITQKWFAMCGNQGFEAWTEWRRTGYPNFLIIPEHSQISNQHPRRFIYPSGESTANLNFPASGVQPLTAKVWWDIL